MDTNFTDLYLERRDEARNMARYYHLTVTQNLFGETIVLRRWGRIDSNGRMKEVISKDLPEAARYIYQVAIKKARRGYRQSRS